MRKALVLVGLVLLSLSCAVPPTPVVLPGLDKERYLRVNLRPESTTLYSTNYLSLAVGARIGDPVRITSFNSQAIKLLIGGIEYTMRPIDRPFPTSKEGVATFLEKYFVDSPAEIDVDSLEPQDPPKLRDLVRQGERANGMSKEQVYASLGPPAHVASGVPTMNMPLAEILKQDVWTYRHQQIVLVPTSVRLHFVDGLLARTEP